MSLIVQTVMRLMGKLGRPGERRCAACGHGYRPVPGDRGYCPRCVREEGGSDKDKAGDSGRPFRED